MFEVQHVEELQGKLASIRAIAGVHIAVLLAALNFEDVAMGPRAKLPPGKSPLHAAGGSWVFLWHAFCRYMVDMFGIKRVLTVTQCARTLKLNTDDDIALAKLFGFQHAADGRHWGKAARQCDWWVNVKLSDGEIGPLFIMPCAEGFSKECMQDGSVWTPSAESLQVDANPAPLRRNWPQVCEDMTRQGQSTDFARYMWSSLQVQKDGYTFRAGVPFFLRHLGLEQSPLAHVCQVFPCRQKIDLRDGSSPPSKGAYASTCGEHFFCVNCKNVLEVLGGAWEMSQATEVICRAVEALLPTWQEKSSNSELFEWKEAIHLCGLSCVHKP